jgi:glycosyltransferase involved in cell wall biosynthesis
MCSIAPASTNPRGNCGPSDPPGRHGLLHILYLADIRFPLERANGIQTFETCRALAARGHAVTLLVRPDTATPRRDPWQFYGAAPDPRLSVSAVPDLAPSLRRVGYVASALAAVAARRHDVVFTRDLGVASFTLGAPVHLRAPLVYESHGYAPVFSEELASLLGQTAPPGRRKLRRLEAREQRVWQRAEGYVTLTSTHLGELVKRFGSRDNTAVAPDGTRLDTVSPFVPPSAGIPPIVGYAGHLYPWKGVDVLLDALAQLPAARGLIIGGQPGEADRMRLEERAGRLGLAERVTFTGWLPPADVAAQLKRCHVLVVPNTQSATSERYTSPLKVFEYMAAARPIVASALPALKEVLHDDRNAWLVPPGDPTALASAIQRLAADPHRAARLARQARDDAASYTWGHRAGRLELVLLAALGARP